MAPAATQDTRLLNKDTIWSNISSSMIAGRGVPLCCALVEEDVSWPSAAPWRLERGVPPPLVPWLDSDSGETSEILGHTLPRAGTQTHNDCHAIANPSGGSDGERNSGMSPLTVVQETKQLVVALALIGFAFSDGWNALAVIVSRRKDDRSC